MRKKGAFCNAIPAAGRGAHPLCAHRSRRFLRLAEMCANQQPNEAGAVKDCLRCPPARRYGEDSPHPSPSGTASPQGEAFGGNRRCCPHRKPSPGRGRWLRMQPDEVEAALPHKGIAGRTARRAVYTARRESFTRFFQKIADSKGRAFGSAKKGRSGQMPEAAHFRIFLQRSAINTPCPSIPSPWQACRSRGTHPRSAPARRACSGWTARPLPSSSPRRPRRRTTSS